MSKLMEKILFSEYFVLIYKIISLFKQINHNFKKIVLKPSILFLTKLW